MDQLIGVTVLVLVIGFVLFGYLALANVDRTKTGSMPSYAIFSQGVFVPEAILTERGKRWATYRNFCFAAAFLTALLYFLGRELT